MSKRIIRSFLETLGLASRGKFVEKCDAELKRVIEALEALPDEKGKAQIIVTLDITFVAGRYGVKPSVKVKLPEEKGFPENVFWALDGGLTLEHPNQIDMFGPRDAESRGAKA